MRTLFGQASRKGQVFNVLIAGITPVLSNLDFIADWALFAVLAYLHTFWRLPFGNNVHTVSMVTSGILLYLPALINFSNFLLSKSKNKMKKWFMVGNLPLSPIIHQATMFWLMCKKTALDWQISSKTLPDDSCQDLPEKIGSTTVELKKQMEEKNRVGKNLEKKLLVETTIESQYQTYLKIILLLLTWTTTPTDPGLKSVFGESRDSIFGIPSLLFFAMLTISPIVLNTKSYISAINRNLTLGGTVVLAVFAFLCNIAKFAGGGGGNPNPRYEF